jgi:hypothetical protein
MAILAERNGKNVVLYYCQLPICCSAHEPAVLVLFFLIKKIRWIFTTWQQKKIKKSSVTHAKDFFGEKNVPKITRI